MFLTFNYFLGTNPYERMKKVVRTVLVVKEEEHKQLPQKPPLEILRSMTNYGMVSVLPC